VGKDSYLGGDIYSIKNIALQDRAVVQGIAYVNGKIYNPELDDDDVNSRIKGGISNEKVKYGRVYDWTIYWPSSNVKKELKVDTPPEEVTPGAYQSLLVQPRATAILTGGTYFFESVTIEADANIIVRGNGEPVIVFVRDSIVTRGRYTHSTSASDFFVGYAGQKTAIIDAPFSGTVVAPNAVILLSPLNGEKHEGSYFGRWINAEARTEVVFTPFSHWDKIFDQDKCASNTKIYDCTKLETWEQKNYQSGHLVQDGTFVYAVHTESLAGLDSKFEPGVGNRWWEAWSHTGYCSTLENANELIGQYSSENVHLYFPFDKIWEGNTERFLEDISGNKAVVHGNSAFVSKNAGRNGCHTFDALSLNVDYDTLDTGLPKEMSFATVEKPTDDKTVSVILAVKRLGSGSSTILTNLNESGSLFSIGYSEDRGVYVTIRNSGEVYSVESGCEEDLPLGLWTELAVMVEGLNDGTSRVWILKDGQSLLTDSGEGVIVNGELDLSGGEWLLGGYKNSSQADVTKHFTGLMGPTLISNTLVPPQLASGFYARAMAQPLSSESSSSAGTEPDIHTAAPGLPSPNPLSHVKIVATPKANTKGTAKVVYPIDVPQAFVGPTPVLNLDYSSARKNGNVGVGWRLHMSTIEIDTSDRGVPYIWNDDPFDSLLLDGQKLKFWKTDSSSGDDLYRLVLESSFVTVRHVNKTDPDGGSFVAEYPDGRTDYYGSDTSSKLADPNHSDRVFKWYIDRREDKDDNAILYVWGTHQYTSDEAQRWNSMALEPRIEQILYSKGHVIDFEWSGISGTSSHNQYISGRGGFLVADPNLLYEITFVDPLGNALKSIKVNYESGAFGKYQLTSVVERNEAGGKLNEHTFSYTEPGYEYPIDGDPIDLGQDNRYFKSAKTMSDNSSFTTLSNVTGESGHSETATTTRYRTFDFNGDGVDDIVDFEYVEGTIRSTLGVGNHPTFNEYVERTSDTPWQLFDILQSDPSCAYPFNKTGDGFRYPIAFSQTYSYGFSDPWKFKRSGMYDINGDGAQDFVAVCQDKYIVVFSDNGNLKFRFDDIVEYPVPMVSTMAFHGYPFDEERSYRTDDNEWIELYSLESERTIRDSKVCHYSSSVHLDLCVTQAHKYASLAFLDVNGDGWADRLFGSRFDSTGLPGAYIYALLNRGPVKGYDEKRTLMYEPLINNVTELEYVQVYEITNEDDVNPRLYTNNCERQRVADINGDGLPDIIRTPMDLLPEESPRIEVHFNSGTFNSDPFLLSNMPVVDPLHIDEMSELSGQCIRLSSSHRGSDIISQGYPHFSSVPGLKGNSLRQYQFYDELYSRKQYERQNLVDMNGDGLLDFVMLKSEHINPEDIEYVWVCPKDSYCQNVLENIGYGLYVAINLGAEFRDLEKWAETSREYLAYQQVIIDEENHSNENYQGTFLRDCNGDGIPDFQLATQYESIGLPVDSFEWFCRENITGKIGRLREIKNEINGRRMVLKYKDDNPLYQDPESENNFNTRTVLAAVEIDNEKVPSVPLEKRYYYYTDGAEYEGYKQKDKNRFLGWREVETRIFPDNETREVYFYDESSYDYEYFEPPSTDFRDSSTVSGRLLRKETGYELTGNGKKTLSVEFIEYEDVNHLNTSSLFKYVYPNGSWKEQYDLDGNCLGDTTSSGSCLFYSSSTGQDIAMDDERGMISSRTIRYFGDQSSKFDNKTILQVYNDFGEEYRNFLQGYQLYAGDEREAELQHIENVVYDYVDGRIESQTRTDNNGQSLTNSFTYYDDGSLKTTVAPGGITTQFKHSYDNDGRAYVNTTILPDGSQVEVSYDYFGRIVEEIEVNGHTTGYTYDDKGRITDITSTRALEEWGDEKQIHFDYSIDSGHSQLYWCVSIEGTQEEESILLDNCYDATGRIIQEKARMEVEGDMKWVVSGKLKFDEYGRIHKKGKSTTHELDSLALGYVENEMVNATEFDYTPLGQILKIIHSDKTFKDFEYKIIDNWKETSEDHNVNVNLILYETKITSSENEETRIYENVSGETIGVVQVGKDGGTKRILSKEIYSPYEKSVTDPLGRISGKRLDFLGRVEWMTTPDAGRFSYVYNEQGLTRKVTHEGLTENEDGTRETFLYYDDFGRPTFVDHEGEDRDIAFSYYPAQDENVELWNRSQLQSVAVGKYESDQLQEVQLLTEYEYGVNSVTKRRTLNNLDNTTGETHTRQADMKYVFDPYGRTTEVHYPDDEIVRYSYDSGGRLFSISGEGISGKGISGENLYINQIHYNTLGQRTLVENGNGIQTKFDYYDENDLLKSIDVNDGENQKLLASTYHYNARKLIETIENEEYTLGYQYDGLGRLSAGTKSVGDTPTHDNSYEYDVGDRLKISSNNNYDGFLSYSPDSAVPDEFVLTKLDGSADTITKQFTINPWGEMEAVRTLNNDTEVNSRQFGFSSDGTLKSVEDTDTDLRVDYNYDAQGNRVYKKSVSSDGVEKESYYLFPLFVEKGDSMNKHISDGTLVVATRTEQDKVRYPIANHIGSTIMTTDEEGTVLSESVYDPFGNKWSETGEATETGERQFTNQVYDSETGLYYFNTRYYDPQLGMFISPDPAMSGSNHYVYASGNPVHRIDLSGLNDFQCDGSGCNWPPITISIGGGSGGDSGGGNGGGDDGGSSESWGSGSGTPDRTSFYADARSAEDQMLYTDASSKDTATLTQYLMDPGADLPDGGLPILPIFAIPSMPGLAASVAQSVAAGIGAASTWLATQLDNVRITATRILQSIMPQATGGLSGPYGSVAKSVLQRAASGGGPTTSVVTNLTQRPAPGRALSVAIGQGADSLAAAARSGGQLFRANIPNALISELEAVGLVTRSTTLMNGIHATELRFHPLASEYILPFFQ
jgi:RHS repeat-associated protein